MDKKIVIAIVLSVIIWLGYFWIFPPPKQENIDKGKADAKEQVKTKEVNSKITDTQQVKKNIKNVEALLQKQGRKKAGLTGFEIDEIWLKKNQIPGQSAITMETDMYQVRFLSAGAQVDSFRYKKYKEKDGKPVELVIQSKHYHAPKSWPFAFDLKTTDDSFLSEAKFMDSLPFVLKRSEEKNSTVMTAAIQGRLDGSLVLLEKIFRFQKDKNYFELELRISNLDKKNFVGPFENATLQIGHLVGPDIDLEDPYNPMKFGYQAAGNFHTLDKQGGFFSDKPPALTKAPETNIQMAALHSRYFLLSVVPMQPFRKIWGDTRPATAFQLGGFLSKVELSPGEVYQNRFFVYAGEKEKDILQSFVADISKAGYKGEGLADALKETIDVHWSIEIVRDLLVKLLLLLNSLFHNYGLSIIAFAIITKLIFWPLNQKSADSMKKMSDLAPQMKDLREKYKDNPAEMNKRTMELYRKNKVNPASGCLPILIQLPFFIALYSALSNSAILWNAPFYGWIQDLSIPDTVGHLPQQLGGISINILPIIMIITQFFQQKLTTPTTADPNQKRMMYLMPVLLIFIFWQMPSGLVLYWSVQNVLAIGQQVYTNHKGKKLANA